MTPFHVTQFVITFKSTKDFEVIFSSKYNVCIKLYYTALSGCKTCLITLLKNSNSNIDEVVFWYLLMNHILSNVWFVNYCKHTRSGNNFITIPWTNTIYSFTYHKLANNISFACRTSHSACLVTSLCIEKSSCFKHYILNSHTSFDKFKPSTFNIRVCAFKAFSP